MELKGLENKGSKEGKKECGAALFTYHYRVAWTGIERRPPDFCPEMNRG